jgi:hypothetical protein
MKCPLVLSLRVIPIPSRITRKSTRPRASDRSMCCQPGNRHGLSASETDRHRRYSIRMQPRWTMQDPRHDPNTSPHVQGAGRQGNLFSFRSRHKNVLDIPSYRSGDYTSVRFFFASGRRQSALALSLLRPVNAGEVPAFLPPCEPGRPKRLSPITANA